MKPIYGDPVRDRAEERRILDAVGAFLCTPLIHREDRFATIDGHGGIYEVECRRRNQLSGAYSTTFCNVEKWEALRLVAPPKKALYAVGFDDWVLVAHRDHFPAIMPLRIVGRKDRPDDPPRWAVTLVRKHMLRIPWVN